MKPVRAGWKIWPPVIILRYWIVQGMFFMNFAERAHRLMLEFTIFCLLYLYFFAIKSNMHIVYILIMSHTFSFIFNGHLFAMFTHDLFWFGLYKDKRKFYFYVDEMRSRLYRKNPGYASSVVFFGSLARGIFRDTSDLDVRFVAKKGLWNAIRTSHLVFIERLHAFFAGFPIDAYMFRTEDEIRKKMDVDKEHPVCIYSSGDMLQKILPETQSYKVFEKEFCPVPECDDV